jgi:hypothetical protein
LALKSCFFEEGEEEGVLQKSHIYSPVMIDIMGEKILEHPIMWLIIDSLLTSLHRIKASSFFLVLEFNQA